MTVLTLLAATAAAAAPIVGRFGGLGAAVELGSDGGRVALGCAHGAIDGPLRAGAHGRFAAAGRLTVQRPGPQLVEQEGAVAGGDAPARFDGRIDGDTLTLRIRRTGAVPETYTLTRDRPAKMVRCY